MPIFKILITFLRYFILIFSIGFFCLLLKRSIMNYQIWIKTIERRPRKSFLKKEMIKDLYKINPSRWELADSSDSPLLRYLDKDFKEESKKISWLDFDETVIYIKLSFFDYLWLKRMSKKYLKEKKNQEKMAKDKENLQAIITTAQEDILKIKKQSQKEIEEAKSTYTKIYNNLK